MGISMPQYIKTMFHAIFLTHILIGSSSAETSVHPIVERTIAKDGIARISFSFHLDQANQGFISRADIDASPQISELRRYIEISTSKHGEADRSEAVQFLRLSKRGGYGSATVTADGLAILRESPLLQTIALETVATTSMIDAFNLTQSALLFTGGLNGNNVEVAVLDSNFRSDHPSLVNSIFEEFCFSSTTLCNGASSSMGSGVAAGPSINNWPHGTAVAGVLVSRGVANPPHPTPPASPTQGIKLSVFRVSDTPRNIPYTLVNAALDQILDELEDPQSSRRYKLINLSFGGALDAGSTLNNYNYHTCDQYKEQGLEVPDLYEMREKITILQRLGVIVVAAAGNRFPYSPGMQHPSCFSKVISVSSTWDSSSGSFFDQAANQNPVSCTASVNRNTCYSNRNWMTKISAPGSSITMPWVSFTAVPDTKPVQYTTASLTTNTASGVVHGTSFASPIVVSCLSQIYQQLPTVDYRRLVTALAQEPTANQSLAEPTQIDPYRLPLLKCSNALTRAMTPTPWIKVARGGLSGSWYKQDENGQGFVIEVNESNSPRYVFGGWFTFRHPTSPSLGGQLDQRWLTFGNSGTISSSAQEVNLDIYQSRGGSLNTPNTLSPNQVSIDVGNAILRFHNCSQATLTYDITSSQSIVGIQSGSIDLERVLTGIVRCNENDFSQQNLSVLAEQDAAAERFQWSGSWFKPGMEGQGIIMENNSSMIQPFISWYTFKPQPPVAGENLFSRGRWFTMQHAVSPTAGYLNRCNQIKKLTITATTGGQFRVLAGSSITRTSVGQAEIQFNSCNTALFKYKFDVSTSAGEFSGQSGSIELQRVGNSAPVACTFTPPVGSCPLDL